MRSLEKRIFYFWTAVFSVFGLFLGSGFAGAIYAYSSFTSVSVFVLLSIAFLSSYYAFLRYRNWGFELKEDHLYIEHGVLKKVYSMVPYVRVQHIDTDRGPIERMLGLSTLRVYTAGSKGADIKIPGLDKEEAAKLQKKLRDSAISSEKGFDAV